VTRKGTKGRQGGIKLAKWENLLHVSIIVGFFHVELDAEEWVGRIHGVQRIDLLEYLAQLLIPGE
jgi:hypothetical protein